MSVVEVVGAYRACFRVQTKVKKRDVLTPAAAVVLDDLARFCHVNRSTASANAIQMAVLEGRRQVWLHLQHKLNLTDAQVDRIAYQPDPEPEL